MSAINEPHGHTHSSASSDHYSHLKVVLFCEILKIGDGLMKYRRTDNAKIVINIPSETVGQPRGSKNLPKPREKTQ